MKKLSSICFLAVAFLLFAAAKDPSYYTIISLKGTVLAETASGDELPLRVGKMLAADSYISVGEGSEITLSEHGAIVTFAEGTVGKVSDLVDGEKKKPVKIPRGEPAKAVKE